MNEYNLLLVKKKKVYHDLFIFEEIVP